MKLRESDRLDPANGTKLNLADCEERRGRLASAWELYRKLVESLPSNDGRAPYVKQQAAALEPRVPRLSITLLPDAPVDTTAKIGSLVLTAASFGTSLPLDPGAYDVVISSGRSSRTYSVRLGESERQFIEVTPNSQAEGVPAPPSRKMPSRAPLDTPPRSARTSGSAARTLGYVAGGLGVAGLAVGSIAGIMGLNQEATGDDNCNQQLKVCNQTGIDANDAARSLATVSTIGFVVGIVGVGVGAYVVLTSAPDDEVAVTTNATESAASLAIGGRW